MTTALLSASMLALLDAWRSVAVDRCAPPPCCCIEGIIIVAVLLAFVICTLLTYHTHSNTHDLLPFVLLLVGFISLRLLLVAIQL